VGQPVPEDLPAQVPVVRSRPDALVKFTAGEVAPHAWEFEAPKPEQIELGPGRVDVARTRVFEAHQEVRIQPGTRFAMGAQASLIFLGKVTFQGTPAAPIVIERQGREFWGAVALVGPATQGSRLQHVQASGGSNASYRKARLPAMLNIHDTSDITLDHCRFGRNAGPDDVVHAAYVTGLSVTDSVIQSAALDGWDLEFARGRLERVRVVNAGDDAIDLMASDLEIVDALLLGAKGNGISAGEQSRVALRNSLVAGAKVGVLAKNASRIDLFGTILFKNTTQVHVYERTVRYEGESEVNADSSFGILTGKELVKRDDRGHDRLDFGTLRPGFPPPGVLDAMLRDLLGLESWTDLAGWVTAEQSGDVL